MDWSALSLVTGPASEPVTTAEAKTHSNVTVSDDDTLIGTYISAAREYIEGKTRRALFTQTWDFALDCFPCGVIELPLSPTQSVTSITYYDTNGNSQVLSSSLYQLDILSEPARIVPAVSQTWPDTQYEKLNAVVIRFVAGWSQTSAIPPSLKLAVKMMVDHMYKHRSPTIEGTLSAALDQSLRSIIAQWRMPELAGLAA